ncbi:mast cell protease 1A-like, partial [Sinocyclocheilus rhinocerous]|uniref:mast cell protease 1A-like n=1 Tax=Sinocyclocheilus rhinocerous TaxID=307959 RepID=UPI0007BA0633
TAAHCWNRYPEILTVVVGTHDLSKSKILDRIRVKHYFPHPKSRPRPYQNDIMLLMLYKKINLNNHVKWISLPKKEEDVTANHFCSVTVWGRLRTNGPLSTRLKEANVFIENHAECHHRWGNEYIDSQMICVYGSGGSCEYDSGGPLVCGNIAVGITSFGDISHCNSPVKPNVYTKISAFLPWIQQTIRNVK